jgi:deoxyinosine 3'endonuclease (endonuclease V)
MASRIDARVSLTRMDFVAGADIAYDLGTKKMYATVLICRRAWPTFASMNFAERRLVKSSSSI